MNGLFLAELARENPTVTFQAVEEQANFITALRAVVNGDADCVVGDNYTMQILDRTQPGLRQQLQVLRTSPEFPDAVIIGEPGHVDRLRSGMWAKLQRSMTAFSNTTEGQELSSYWRMRGFRLPDEAFHASVSEAVKHYPEPSPPSP
jgi:ABC-type phosphate/phosphonate transport system substrate-binding protein